MGEELNKAYKQIQNEERKNVFYGENDVISRPGFDSIEAFDKEIKDVREVIKDYDFLLMENQSKLKDVVRDLDLFKSHPEMALPNQVDTLNNQYTSLMDNQNKYLEKQAKENKYLDELLEAKKEFIRETRFHYKNEAKDKVTLLNEYDAKQKELKSLENKISLGMANGLEQARYDSLKNEVIPDLEEMLGIKKKESDAEKVSESDDQIVNEDDNSLDEDDDLEIVNEEDGRELTKKEKFKSLAKKVAKVAATVGGVALVAGAIYHFMKGDATPITQMMHGVSDAVGQVANSVDPDQVDLSSTGIGDYSSIYSSNDAVMNGVNAMTPNEWASDQIVGFVDANNVVTPAHTIGDIVNAQNQGVDVQSIAVGNGSFSPGNVSGFVDSDVINNVVGGHTR